MTNGNSADSDQRAAQSGGFRRSLGLFDSSMIVAGSMIGSGIFIVTAEIARNVGSPGWVLATWVITALLTVAAALSYGELAAMMPRAGGQYVYLREAWSPLCGFLYGWTLFLVIQTGTIAAVAVGFARYLGVFWPPISESRYIIPPIHVSNNYALSLSTAQLVAVLLLGLLTLSNSFGIRYGKLVQNIFTTAKIAALLAVVAFGVFVGWNRGVVHGNFADAWTARGNTPVSPGVPIETVFGLVVALCVAQVGSLFSADAWNNITFTAGEVKNPRRNVPLSLAIGTGLIMTLYFLANVAYLVVLPLEKVQSAPSDRVAAAMLEAVFPGVGAALMAGAIMISTFGCINGMVLSGARAYFAMACDGLFFRRAANLNRAQVPAASLWMQGAWAVVLVLARTYDPQTKTYGNLQQLARLRRIGSAAILHSHHRRRIPPAPHSSRCRTSLSRVRISGAARPVHRRSVGDFDRPVRLSPLDDTAGNGRCAHWSAGLLCVSTLWHQARCAGCRLTTLHISCKVILR